LELNKIYNEDCIQGMAKLPDKSIDLVVTDPPYLMDYKSNRRVKQDKFDKILNDKDAHDLITESIKQYHRVLKDNTAIYMFCSWHHVDFFKQEIEKYFQLKNIIVWNKNNHGSGDLKGSYAPKHEFVLFAHKGRALLQSKRIEDVIDCPKISSNKLVHPTEKPIELLQTFIQSSSYKGGIVLDGFVGGGSTALASITTGRNYIGFELDENYYNVATERIKNFIT
jgi:site-specific DNA-methyltransferase (adenine-specific)